MILNVFSMVGSRFIKINLLFFSLSCSITSIKYDIPIELTTLDFSRSITTLLILLLNCSDTSLLKFYLLIHCIG